MDIQKIIKSVTKEQIQSSQKKAKAHFEKGPGMNGQMNMIAFD